VVLGFFVPRVGGRLVLFSARGHSRYSPPHELDDVHITDKYQEESPGLTSAQRFSPRVHSEQNDFSQHGNRYGSLASLPHSEHFSRAGIGPSSSSLESAYEITRGNCRCGSDMMNEYEMLTEKFRFQLAPV
jgi:hypothetical protein